MITISNLVKDHDGLRVLDGVSMTIKRAEVAAVIGPSGGGKSTLLRCINGLETFQEGVIQVEDLQLTPGEDPDSAKLLRLRRKVGMVFQQFNLFPHMNVLDNVLAGPVYVLKRSREEAEPEARRLLSEVGLAEKVNAKPDQLSGGQQQRVAIARALAVNPSAILFDEPTSALDPQMAGEVMRVIAELADRGQTMMIVTHAMEFARRVAHTVHVMYAGKVAESGPPEQIFDQPREEVTRVFLNQITV